MSRERDWFIRDSSSRETGEAHTPWYVGEWDEHLGYDCMSAGIAVKNVTGKTILVLDATDFGAERFNCPAEVRARVEATATLIVKAVNAHAALVEALQRTLSWLTSYPGGGAEGAYQQARASLRSAGEE